MLTRARTSLTAIVGLALSAMLASSCYFTADGGWIWWAGDDPELVDAEAGCFRDGGASTWYFEADVFDIDGPDDIVSVEAHAYDTWWGRQIGWFELRPTSDPWWWYAERPEVSTGLDCHSRDYEIDFIVTDWWGGWDTMTVVPDTW